MAVSHKRLITSVLHLAPLMLATVAGAQTVAVTADTIHRMEQVVVTGQYSPQSVRQSVYKVRTIGQERLRIRGATDLIGVLNNEAGIRFNTDYTLGETNISFMGMTGQSVKILLDGVPLVDRGSTRQSLGQIDINTVERIEIVEGPMSVTYGTDALAGVINIITKKPWSGSEQLSVTARIQEESTGKFYRPFTDDGVHNESLGVNWQKKSWNAAGSFSRNDFGGWTGNGKDRVQEIKPKLQYLAGGRVGYSHRTFNAWYRLDFLNEEIFSAGPVNVNNYIAFDQHYITNRYTHGLQSDWQVHSRFRLSTALSYQDYTRKTRSYKLNYRDGSKALAADSAAQDVSTFKTFFIRSTGQWRLSDKLSLQPGIELKNDHTMGQRIKGSPTITDYSLFASAEVKPLNRINIRPGLRFSKNSVYKAPPVIPSLNVKLAAGAHTDVRLSYARGFRAPILRELYFLFVDGNHNIRGNANLKAETSNSYNASVTREWKTGSTFRLNTSLSGFYNRVTNQLNLGTDPGDNRWSTYINIEKYRTAGGMLESNASFKNLSATLAVYYTGRYNRYRDNGTLAAGESPAYTWSPEVSCNLTYKLPGLGADIGLFYKFTGRLPSYMLETNTAGQSVASLTHIASWHWADLTLSKTLFHYIVLQGGVKNIFNVIRLNNTSATADGAHSTGGPVLAAYGRSFFTGLAFNWIKK